MTTTPNTPAVRPEQDMQKMLAAAMPELKAVAPKYVNVTRLVQLAIEAKMRNSALLNCSPVSVLNFCKKCAEMGTDRIGAGGMWAVPFRNNKTGTTDMTPIPDWRLLIEKAKKAKAITHASTEAVYAADVFEYERGLNPQLRHVPAKGKRGDIVAVYCVYMLPDGTRDFVVMDWTEDILPIRNRSKAWQNFEKNGYECPWNTDPAEMGKKTVAKRALKPFEGASIELTQLIALDNASLGYGDRDLLPERAPVEMPVELPASTAPATSAPEAGKTETPPPAGQIEGNTVTGIVEDVETFNGTNKTTKKPFTRYGVLVNGKSYGTFSKELRDEALALKGKEAVLTVEQKGKFWNVNAIQEVEAEQQPPAGDPPPKRDRQPGEDDLQGLM